MRGLRSGGGGPFWPRLLPSERRFAAGREAGGGGGRPALAGGGGGGRFAAPGGGGGGGLPFAGGPGGGGGLGMVVADAMPFRWSRRPGGPLLEIIVGFCRVERKSIRPKSKSRRD